MKKDLIVFIAHIDDFECACYGYVLNHYKEYNKIKIVTATTWPAKVKVWEENKLDFPQDLQNKLGLLHRKLPFNFCNYSCQGCHSLKSFCPNIDTICLAI